MALTTASASGSTALSLPEVSGRLMVASVERYRGEIVVYLIRVLGNREDAEDAGSG